MSRDHMQADRIQETMGVMFCLTTMAAAGMGNMVSDLAGIMAMIQDATLLQGTKLYTTSIVWVSTQHNRLSYLHGL